MKNGLKLLQPALYFKCCRYRGSRVRSLIFFVCLLFGINAVAQQDSTVSRSAYIGGYYSLIIEGGGDWDGVEYVGMVHHCFNLHVRSQLTERWFLGWEGILTVVTSKEYVNNPFMLFGLHGEYRLLNQSGFSIYGRLGGSTGNLSYAGNGVPERRFVMNITFGGNVDYRITSRLSIDAGYYNHLPINKIKDSYSAAMPFVGFHFML